MAKKGRIGDRYRTVEINHDNVKKHNRKEYRKIAVFAVALLIIACGTSYALWTAVLTGKEKVEVNSGTFEIEFTEGNVINLSNATPMTDLEGLSTDAYTFSITNTGTLNAKYDISLEEDTTNTLSNTFVKYSLKIGDEAWSTPISLSNGLVLATNKTLNSGDDVDCQLKIWLDQSVGNTEQGLTYGAKIVVTSVQENAETNEITNSDVD